MPDHPKLLNGQFQIKSIGQLMANGTWNAYSVITEHFGSHSDDTKRLVSSAHQTELDAVNAGLHWGMKWLNEHHPIPD